MTIKDINVKIDYSIIILLARKNDGRDCIEVVAAVDRDRRRTVVVNMYEDVPGFYETVPVNFTFVFWSIGLSVFILALKKFDLSTAYAIWAGIGILGVSIIGMVYFKEPYSGLKMASIIVITAGVIMLNISDILLNKQ